MTASRSFRLALAAAATGLLAGAAVADQPRPGGGPPRRASDQDAARRALLDGNVMPFSVLKRRVEQQIGGDADYLGSEFMSDRNSYRLKFMRDRNVLWVDVDGRTGDITGWAR